MLRILSNQPEIQGGVFFSLSFLVAIWRWSVGQLSWLGVLLIMCGVSAITKKITSGGSIGSLSSFKGKTVIITGGNTGIGKATAIELAKAGAHVVIACRSLERGEVALKQIKKESNNTDVELRQLDLASFNSIRKFAKGWGDQKIDLLINNAGVMISPYGVTEDGFELQFGTNHLGHFLLTNLLLPHIIDAENSRIINVSSLAHLSPPKTISWDRLDDKQSYNRWKAYAISKIANIYFTIELQRRLREKNTNVTTYAIHPGAVRTELTRHVHPLALLFVRPFLWLFFKSPLAGAQTTLYCASAPLHELEPGAYYQDCKKALTTNQAADKEEARKLWELSERFTDLTSS